MKCKVKLEIIKILTLEFELSAGKKEDDVKEDTKKEPPAPVAAPSK